MLKDDVKIEAWSSRRDMDRSELMAFRPTEEERNQIVSLAYELKVRPSDVIRGCLIYAGAINAPKPEAKDMQPAEASAAVLK